MQFATVIFCLLICSVFASPVIEKEPETPKEVPSIQGKNAAEDQDSSSEALKIPVDNANKLLYDLDVHVKQLFDDSTVAAKEEKSADVSEDPHAYSAANRELDFYPRQSDANHQSPASLIIQLENLEKRLLSTIQELQTRRRYFSSTMLRQMYNSVHRIRVNIGRIQNQFSPVQPQAVHSANAPTRPAPMNLQQRVSDIQKAVNDIITRVTSTFQGPNAQKPQVAHPSQVAV